MRLPILTLVSVTLAPLLGCDPATPPAPPPTTAPSDGTAAPTNDRRKQIDETLPLTERLVGTTWRFEGEPEIIQCWRFNLETRMFKAWIRDDRSAGLQGVFPDAFPPGVMLVAGTWEVTSDELTLTELSSPEVVGMIGSAAIPFRWVEGGEIEIGGHRYWPSVDEG